MAKEKTLKLPPLPDLTWGVCSWNGEIKLDFWAGGLTRVDAYRGNPASTGLVELRIFPPDEMASPTMGQVSAFQYLLANQDVINENLLQAVFRIYPEERDSFREDYGYKDDMDAEEKESFEEDYGEDVPVLKKPEEFKQIIRLHTVHIIEAEKAGIAYFGFEFNCNWEEEHGLGVLMHKDRVVNVGPAEVSFSSSEEEDADIRDVSV